jgi:hypothetical protein
MNKQCLECKKLIEGGSKQDKSKIYCSKICNKYFNRKKAALKASSVKRKSNLRLNSEFRYLVDQCKRAMTVQILYGHSPESFIETMDLLINRPKGDVELCHICPVKGKDSIGLFHCRNLFYGGAHQNRKFGNKYVAGGLSIPKDDLVPKWRIPKGMKSDDILVKIEEYLGDVLLKYLEMRPVKKSRKVPIIRKILGIDSSLDFDMLMGRSLRALTEQWANITHSRPYILNPSKESKFLAYMDGISRFIKYDKINRKILKSIRSTMVIGYMALERTKQSATYNKLFYCKYEQLIRIKYGQAMLKDPESWSVFKDLIYDTAFDVLHGATIDAKKFRRLVKSSLKFPDRAWVTD